MHYGETSFSASDIAEAYGISTPLMAKVLQKLARGGLVAARHGSGGAYTLAREAPRITALDAIHAIEGPLFITSCVTHRGQCGQTNTCIIREPLRKVNDSILDVLNKVTFPRRTEEASSSEVVDLRVKN